MGFLGRGSKNYFVFVSFERKQILITVLYSILNNRPGLLLIQVRSKYVSFEPYFSFIECATKKSHRGDFLDIVHTSQLKFYISKFSHKSWARIETLALISMSRSTKKGQCPIRLYSRLMKSIPFKNEVLIRCFIKVIIN